MLQMKALDRITMLFNLGDLFNNIYRTKRHFSYKAKILQSIFINYVIFLIYSSLHILILFSF